MSILSEGPVVARARVHANGAVTSFLELRYESSGGWSTARYWIDELSGVEERGDRREFGADEAAARGDYAARLSEGLTAPIDVSCAPSLLEPSLRFPEVVDARRSPSGRLVELRRGPEGWALDEGGGLSGWSLWGEEERAAADTFRRLAADLPSMPPLHDGRLHRYPELVDRRHLGYEGAVDCSLELRRGRSGWAVAELRVYPPGERWAPERIEWRDYVEEPAARRDFSVRSRIRA